MPHQHLSDNEVTEDHTTFIKHPCLDMVPMRTTIEIVLDAEGAQRIVTHPPRRGK